MSDDIEKYVEEFDEDYLYLLGDRELTYSH